MSSETVEIIVRESGSTQAAGGIRQVGQAAGTTEKQVQQMLFMMSNSNLKLAEIARASGSTEQAINSLRLNTGAAAAMHKVHTNEMTGSTEAASHLREMLVALGLALGTREWVALGDEYTRNINLLRQVTTGSQNLSDVQHALFDISQKTHSSFAANVELFTAMAKASAGLGLSQKDVLQVVNSLNSSMMLENKSADEVGGAMRQLALAFATGHIQGRGLHTLMLQFPELTRRIATEMFGGANAVQHFREAATHGQLSAQQLARSIVAIGGDLDHLGASIDSNTLRVVNGMQTQMRVVQTLDGGMIKLAQDVGRVELTVGKAWQNMKNATAEYFGEADRAARITATIAQFLSFAAEHAHLFLGSLSAVGAGLVVYTGYVNAARLATVLWGSSFSWIGLVASLFAAAAVAVVAFGNDIKLTSTGSITLLGAVVGIAQQLWQWFVQVGTAVTAWLGPFSSSVIMIGALIAAMRVLLGINIISFIASVTTGLISMAGATVLAAGPWGILAAAILVAATALAYYNGLLDGTVESIKSVANTIIGQLTSAMERASGTTNVTADSFKNLTASMQGTEQEGAKLINTFDGGVVPALKRAKDMVDTFSNTCVPDMARVRSSVDGAASSFESLSNVAASASKASSTSGGSSGGGGASGKFFMPLSYDLVQSYVQQIKSAVQTSYGPAAASAISGWMDSYLQAHSSSFDRMPISLQQGLAGLNAWNAFKPTAQKDGTLEGIKYILTSIDSQVFGNNPPGFARGGSFTVGGGGGTDSQLVQFMATPNERVIVQTPGQQNDGSGDDARSIIVHMHITAKDAASFQRTERQIVTSLESRLARVRRRGGG